MLLTAMRDTCSKKFYCYIVWAIGNNMFTLQADTSEDTAIKIAQGVKYID